MDTTARSPERDGSPATEVAEEPSRSGVPGWGKVCLLFGVCLLIVFLVNVFVAQPYLIPSGSMEKTLSVGDRVLVNKLAYRFGSAPQRGDIVVFDGKDSFVQDKSGTDFIKRVVGVGGDRVICCDARGRITVNGRSINEPYLYPGNAPSRVRFDIEVPEGRLWVMGDHRDDSRDSRDHLGDPGGGTVPVDEVIGRAERIVWPLSRWRTLEGVRG
jgi:signal peptidase I